MVGQGSKNKTVFKLTIEIALVGSVRNVLASSFYCSILIRCIIVFTASAKILEREASILPSRFYWQFPNYQLQVLALST